MSKAGPRWRPAYIGIGSNLDSPVEQVRAAFGDLAQLSDSCVAAVSSMYRTPPMGPQDQPDYINAVAAILTRLGADDLLKAMMQIEDAHGRLRDGARWGPRTLDLDLLVYSGDTIQTQDLTVPHPGIAERNFVLLPLGEIAPFLQIPGLGPVHKLMAAIGSDVPGIEKVDCNNGSN